MTLLLKKLLPGMIALFGFAACGSEPRGVGTAPNVPQWSLTYGEPNEYCPGAFDRSVLEWNDPADVRHMIDTISGLPKNAKQLACRVSKFYLQSEDFHAIAGVVSTIDLTTSQIMFHPALFRLKPSLSQLMVWKERQIVEDGQRPRFDSKGAPVNVSVSTDTFGAALSYVLLHELGHVANWQPEWRDLGQKLCSPDCEANSWESGLSVKPGRFDAKGKICFYGSCDHRLSVDDLANVYEELDASDFISLYASTNVMEDAAESYAANVVFDNWHWTWETSASERTFDNAAHWVSPEMAAKRAFFAELATIEFPPLTPER